MLHICYIILRAAADALKLAKLFNDCKDRRKKNYNRFHLSARFIQHFFFFFNPATPSVLFHSGQIVLPPHLDNIRDKLAENIHELWGMNKIELGWTYGKVRLLSVITLTLWKNAHKSTLGMFGKSE